MTGTTGSDSIVKVNGEERGVDATTTVGDIVHEVTGQDPESEELGLAVAVDAAIVPRSRWAGTVVHDGAEIEIITAMQGG
ncbi:sulfur carrier protein ThiS [Corynebacterium sp.]|uniref:sulfur carrier protein ThiS n=1 Tax=Corynebacterium sp. TaxID=1720 RepID=UPI0025C6ECF5|nr:sulfur carrier protein ThiS [Corynebacterium sp.]